MSDKLIEQKAYILGVKAAIERVQKREKLAAKWVELDSIHRESLKDYCQGVSDALHDILELIEKDKTYE